MKRIVLLSVVCAVLVAAAAAGAARRAAPPVGPLPSGPVTTIQTHKGEQVAVALPTRGGGRVWRVARAFDARVLEQVSEGDVRGSVVLVFRAKGKGDTTLAFGLTLGERPKAFEARRYTVHVR